MKDRRLRFTVFLTGSICFLIAAAGYWVYCLTQRSGKATLIATIPLALAVLLLRFGYDRFYQHGYYTKKQALAFYLKCKEISPSGIVPSKKEAYTEIYRDIVSEVPLCEELNPLSHYKAIFKEGLNLNGR